MLVGSCCLSQVLGLGFHFALPSLSSLHHPKWCSSGHLHLGTCLKVSTVPAETLGGCLVALSGTGRIVCAPMGVCGCGRVLWFLALWVLMSCTVPYQAHPLSSSSVLYPQGLAEGQLLLQCFCVQEVQLGPSLPVLCSSRSLYAFTFHVLTLSKPTMSLNPSPSWLASVSFMWGFCFSCPQQELINHSAVGHLRPLGSSPSTGSGITNPVVLEGPAAASGDCVEMETEVGPIMCTIALALRP